MMPPAGNDTIRILTVDDHPLICTGITALVAAHPDLEVVATAASGTEAVQQFRAHRPDVTLMDLHLPQMSGLEAIGAIRREFPEARIIVLTTDAGDVQVRRAIQASARGYVLKHALHRELIDAIRSVHAGRKCLSPEVMFEMAEHALDEALTAEELRILRLVAQGLANKEIAAKISVSEGTVKGQVASILSKLGANDRTHAVMIGLRRGMIEA